MPCCHCFSITHKCCVCRKKNEEMEEAKKLNKAAHAIVEMEKTLEDCKVRCLSIYPSIYYLIQQSLTLSITFQISLSIN